MLAVVPPVEIGLVLGSMSIDGQQHSFSGKRHVSTVPYRLISEARSAIARITASLTPGSYSEWPAPSTRRTLASGQTARKRVRGRRRTQQIVAALHDEAGDFRELAGFGEKLPRLHEAVIMEIMRFHERRRGQRPRRVQRVGIEPDPSRRVLGKNPFGVVPGARGRAMHRRIGIENAALVGVERLRAFFPRQ